jgi:hypothetical protein
MVITVPAFIQYDGGMQCSGAPDPLQGFSLSARLPFWGAAVPTPAIMMMKRHTANIPERFLRRMRGKKPLFFIRRDSRLKIIRLKYIVFAGFKDVRARSLQKVFVRRGG